MKNSIFNITEYISNRKNLKIKPIDLSFIAYSFELTIWYNIFFWLC